MTKAEQEKILKEAKTKMHPGYIMFEFSYGNKLVVPHNDGLKIVEAMAYVEEVDTTDYQNHTIKPVAKGPEITIIPRSRYVEMKMAHLLGLNIAEEETE